jgi:hypothetical protein
MQTQGRRKVMAGHTGVYERGKLYKEVWKEPVLVVAKRYGVSGVALAKACKKLAVPLPSRGYWAKVRAGRSMPARPPLAPYKDPPKSKTKRPVSRRSGDTGAKKVSDEQPRQDQETAPLTEPEIFNNTSHTEKKTSNKKRTRKKTSPREVLECLYCNINSWQRTFSSGVNRSRWTKGSREIEYLYDEWDNLQIHATIRHHEIFVKRKIRTGQAVELSILPTHVPRPDWQKKPEAIGIAMVHKDKMFANVTLPADAFYSLFPCLTMNHFKEVKLTLFGMRHRHGDIDRIDFAPEETPMEELTS